MSVCLDYQNKDGVKRRLWDTGITKMRTAYSILIRNDRILETSKLRWKDNIKIVLKGMSAGVWLRSVTGWYIYIYVTHLRSLKGGELLINRRSTFPLKKDSAAWSWSWQYNFSSGHSRSFPSVSCWLSLFREFQLHGSSNTCIHNINTCANIHMSFLPVFVMSWVFMVLKL